MCNSALETVSILNTVDKGRNEYVPSVFCTIVTFIQSDASYELLYTWCRSSRLDRIRKRFFLTRMPISVGITRRNHRTLIEKVGAKNYCHRLRENGFRRCKNNKPLATIRIRDNTLLSISRVSSSKFMTSLSHDWWALRLGWHHIIRSRLR